MARGSCAWRDSKTSRKSLWANRAARVAGVVQGGRLLRRLVRDSGRIDLHVVRPENIESGQPAAQNFSPIRRSGNMWPPWCGGFAPVNSCLIVWERGMRWRSRRTAHTLALIYLLGVVLPRSLSGGARPCDRRGERAVLGFFFLPPRYSFYLTHAEDMMMFCMYFVVALVLGQLVSRIRWQERAERRQEERSTALYLLTRDLADAADVDDMAQRLVRQMAQAFKAKWRFCCATRRELSVTPHPASTLPFPRRNKAWRRGLFALARRRDGSRTTCPLPTRFTFR